MREPCAGWTSREGEAPRSHVALLHTRCDSPPTDVIAWPVWLRTRGHGNREGGESMALCTIRRLIWSVGVLLVGSIALLVQAQQEVQSDSDVARQGALALAAAHGEKPRYGGTFLSAGNEEMLS